ncbi:MAG: Bax inhibitor-1/YccA family protein [Phycicoccus sp.]|nr:Bax inhibitor-1/YccA family protein [Phycicoccus sp.]NMM35592.1 Bax inhibitor-1/YccA family protein [Phycicoccus sp.]
MANPVFDRLDRQISKGDYAGFDRQPSTRGMSGGAGVQDSLNSQQLQDRYNQPSAGPVQMRRVTLDDVVMKTLGLFSIVVLVAAASWFYVADHTELSKPMMLAGMFGGLGVGLAIAFKKTISVPLIVLYAVLEGVLVGAISQVFNTAYEGLVTTAVVATVCTFAGMLLGYKSGLIKVTNKSRRIFGMAIMGYLLFGLVNVVVAFMGYGSGFGIGGKGPMGIAISVLGVGLASYSLAIDFDSVDRAIKAELPEKYSWLLAHGFIVTLVWLYLEFLRLLARLRE